MSYASEILADNPALYLKLNEATGTGTAVDSSAAALPITSSGVTFGAESLVPSDSSSSGSFAGAAYLSAGNPTVLQLSGSFSLTSVLKLFAWPTLTNSTDAAFGTIVGKGVRRHERGICPASYDPHGRDSRSRLLHLHS